MQQHYSYQATLAASEKIRWRVEDLIGGERQLDFTKPFMPDSLVRIEKLDFLTADEKKTLNHIWGNTYLSLFGLVEEFILPFILDHARPQLNGDDYRIRAMLQFASEEAKHIHLFNRFREEFAKGFDEKCAVIGPGEEVAAEVLRHDPLGVAFAILQIEWMSQRHYLESIDDNAELDPQFKSLLKHHWMEEAQHAKLDTLMVEALAEGKSEEELGHAFDEYLEIGAFLDAGLKQQTEFNLDAFERATGRQLNDDECAQFTEVLHQGARWTYLGSGMTHEKFLDTLGKLSPTLRKRVEEVAPAFC